MSMYFSYLSIERESTECLCISAICLLREREHRMSMYFSYLSIERERAQNVYVFQLFVY